MQTGAVEAVFTEPGLTQGEILAFIVTGSWRTVRSISGLGVVADKSLLAQVVGDAGTYYPCI